MDIGIPSAENRDDEGIRPLGLSLEAYGRTICERYNNRWRLVRDFESIRYRRYLRFANLKNYAFRR